MTFNVQWESGAIFFFIFESVRFEQQPTALVNGEESGEDNNCKFGFDAATEELPSWELDVHLRQRMSIKVQAKQGLFPQEDREVLQAVSPWPCGLTSTVERKWHPIDTRKEELPYESRELQTLLPQHHPAANRLACRENLSPRILLRRYRLSLQATHSRPSRDHLQLLLQWELNNHRFVDSRVLLSSAQVPRVGVLLLPSHVHGQRRSLPPLASHLHYSKTLSLLDRLACWNLLHRIHNKQRCRNTEK